MLVCGSCVMKAGWNYQQESFLKVSQHHCWVKNCIESSKPELFNNIFGFISTVMNFRFYQAKLSKSFITNTGVTRLLQDNSNIRPFPLLVVKDTETQEEHTFTSGYFSKVFVAAMTNFPSYSFDFRCFLTALISVELWPVKCRVQVP